MKRANRIKLAVRRGAARAFVLGPLVFLLVAGAGCPSLFESQTHRTAAARIKQAVPGHDGDRIVSGAGDYVNAYATLAAGGDLTAGDTTVTVTNVATLATNFPTILAQGDLLLIIQMQGATIDATDTVGYGSIASEADLGSAGRYEFVGVEGVSGNTITLACALKNSYTVAGKTQVIRVPQFGILTVNSGAAISAPAWNGTTGGVVAVHAQTTLQLNGSIDVSGKGFRGGAADNYSVNANTGVFIYRATGTAANNQGAEKGEGIAGSQTDYDNDYNGRYGRGAPANGGGGGNSHNAGGGGGANAGNVANWGNGQGVMVLNSVDAGADPWSLDPGYTANGGARTNCEGGGRGGYTFSNASQDPITDGPWTSTTTNCSGATSWGGNCRREVGGLGGRPLASSPSTRLFMGGGGGAGDRNNGSTGCAGGNGGGLVFVLAGAIAGSGSILANGATAANAPGGAAGGDAPGGGGGGGTVVVHATTLSAFTISASGGGGGNHTGSSSQTEVEGPGGGGGGGYIAIAGTGSPARSADGGPNGTTTRTVMESFPADGATAGHAGLTSGDASSFLYCGTAPVTTIVTKPSNPSAIPTGTFTFTNTETPVTYQCKIDSGSFVPCNASYTTSTLGDGSHTLTVKSTDAYGNIEASPPSYTWTVDTTLPLTTIATHPAVNSNSSTGSFTFTNTVSTVTYECNLDDAGWGTACTASYTTGALADGPHTLAVRATDTSSSVVESPPVTFAWTIDTVVPDTSILTKPTDPSASSTGAFTFGSTETGVTYACKLDTAAFAACAASYTTPTLTDGSHTLQVRATDAAGNVDVTPATYTWDVNTSLPLTTIATHPANPSASPTGTFTFTNTKSPVTYECKLDDAAWGSCSAAYTTPVLAEGPHTLQVRSTDATAVVEDPPVSFTWIIDTIPPDTTVASGPANPSSSPTGTFTFTSTESPVTYQCKIDTGDWMACTASYTTPALSGGTHTLSVRATDAAGNVDSTPATYTWDITGLDYDGGVALDGGESEAGAVGLDGGAPPSLDAEKPDTQAVDVGTVTVDGAQPSDLPVEVAADTGPRDVVADTQTSGPDTAAPPPEPSPDTAPANEDTAVPPANEDAAPLLETPKLLGGGFCAIAAAPSASPAGFLFLALAGLALLRRRRK